MAAKFVILEDDGHEKKQVYRGADHRFYQAGRGGLPIKDLCRKGGFSDATFYNWRVKYGGMVVPNARLREMDAESNKLKKPLAEAHLDIHALNPAFGAERYPLAVRTDNAPESTSRAFMAWAGTHGIRNILI